jgi:hypothetical protein
VLDRERERAFPTVTAGAVRTTWPLFSPSNRLTPPQGILSSAAPFCGKNHDKRGA